MPVILIKDVMSPAFQLISPDDTIQKAAQIMRDKDIGFLPVAANDKIIGTLTDRDIAIRVVAEGKDIQTSKVRDYMSHHVYYCYDDQTINEVCRNMGEMKVSRFPVVNRSKRLVGIVSYADLSSSASPNIFTWGQQELKSILPAHRTPIMKQSNMFKF